MFAPGLIRKRSENGEGAETRARAPAWWIFAAALFYVMAHALAITLYPLSAQLLSFLFLLVANVTSALACAIRARRDRRAVGWAAFALAMGLWTAGMAHTAYDVSVAGDGNAITISPFFVLYAVPMFFIVASPPYEIWPARVIDALLALVLAGMFFAHSFAFSTLTGTSNEGMTSLTLLFDIQNLMIAMLALARFLTSATGASRSLYGAIAAFGWVYLFVAGYINHFESESEYGAAIDTLIDVPFVMLAAIVMGGGRAPGRVIALPRAAHMVHAASPLVLPVSLLIVSALLIDKRLHLAIAGFVAAMLLSALRGVVVQTLGMEERDKLQQLATVDALTGLPNRRHFDEMLRHEWSQSQRESVQLSVLMIDIDHFKLLNDRHGHPAGDAGLRDVAAALGRIVVDANGFVARYGGEEFAAILRGNGAAALAVAERIRAEVAGLRLPSPADIGFVTVSVGVGHLLQGKDGEIGGLLGAADASLYDAKAAGRNRVASRLCLLTPDDRLRG